MFRAGLRRRCRNDHDKPVEIAVTFAKAGNLGYACSMNMTKGVIQ